MILNTGTLDWESSSLTTGPSLHITTLLQMLKNLDETCELKWKDKINKLMFVCNCTKHSDTGYSSNYLLFV